VGWYFSWSFVISQASVTANSYLLFIQNSKYLLLSGTNIHKLKYIEAGTLQIEFSSRGSGSLGICSPLIIVPKQVFFSPPSSQADRDSEPIIAAHHRPLETLGAFF